MSTFKNLGLKGSHQDSNGNEGAPDSEGSADSGTVPGGDLVGASGFPSSGAPASNSLSGVGVGLELAFNGSVDPRASSLVSMSHTADLKRW